MLIAAAFKIMHNAAADILLKISVGTMVLAALLLIIKIVTNKNPSSVLNK